MEGQEPEGETGEEPEGETGEGERLEVGTREEEDQVVRGGVHEDLDQAEELERWGY